MRAGVAGWVEPRAPACRSATTQDGAGLTVEIAGTAATTSAKEQPASNLVAAPKTSGRFDLLHATDAAPINVA